MNKPSRLYGRWGWEVGQRAVRICPPALSYASARALLKVYALTQRERRQVVVENLRPIVSGEAEQATDRLFANFSRKLVDLWRFEAGCSPVPLFTEGSGIEHLRGAQASGRGLLVVTIHLGNWELGGPLLSSLGLKVVTLSQAEPQGPLTDLRRNARASWGIETIIVGDDPFASVQVIRKLNEGAAVALLIDRPSERSACSVTFFNKNFRASIAVAEYARASGCAILPVYVIQKNGKYEACMLPEVQYDRASLRNPAASARLTQDTMSAFEPILRMHADQWYHFIPIWPH